MYCEYINEVIVLSLLYILTLWGGVAQWVARLTRYEEVVGSNHIKGARGISRILEGAVLYSARLTLNVEAVGSKAPVVSLSKKLNPYCLVLVWLQERIRA